MGHSSDAITKYVIAIGSVYFQDSKLYFLTLRYKYIKFIGFNFLFR